MTTDLSPDPRVRARPRSRTTKSGLLSAARLGRDVAHADLAGRPADALPALASWRRLRRYAHRDTRALLRIAFDTGYGQAVQAAGGMPTNSAGC